MGKNAKERSEKRESRRCSPSRSTNKRREHSTKWSKSRSRSERHRSHGDYNHHYEKKHHREKSSRSHRSDTRHMMERDKRIKKHHRHHERGSRADSRGEGSGTDCIKFVQSSVSKQSLAKKEENREVADAKSEYLPLYGDDEDWPILTGDVDEEAMRLAASIDPSACKTKKKQEKLETYNISYVTGKNDDELRDSVKRTDKAYHARKPDKHYDRKCSLKTAVHKGVKPTAKTDRKTSPHRREHRHRRSRSREKIKRSDSRRGHKESAASYSSSHRRHSSHRSSHTYASLRSRKEYRPCSDSIRRDESATKEVGRLCGILRTDKTKKHSVKVFPKEGKKVTFEDHVKKSGARSCDSVDFGGEKGKHHTRKRPRSTNTDGEGHCKKIAKEDLTSDANLSLSEKTESEVPRKLRWVLTTESYVGNSLEMKSITENSQSGSSNSTGPRAGEDGNSSVLRKKNEIKLRIPVLN